MKNKDTYFEWAHQDQYYIKTDVKLKNKNFFLNDNFLVEFKINLVDKQKDNNKLNKRFSILDAIAHGDNFLTCFFDFKIDTKFQKQKEYNIKSLSCIMSYIDKYLPKINLKKYENLIKKELTGFGNIKSEPHFIHKDLGAFLNQELDDYIKEYLYEKLFNKRKNI